MGILDFLLGLVIGLGLLCWQQMRQRQRLTRLLRELQTADVETSPFSATSQLALTVARQQRIQQQLQSEVQTYQSILHAAPVGYLQLDDENRLVWCNQQARSLLSMTSEMSVSTPENPRLLLELVRSYELDALVEQARNSKTLCQEDWVFYPVSQDLSQLTRQRSYMLRGYAVPMPKQHVGVFLESRQESVQLKQQLDRWASDVAHELKTPLTSIRLIAETLQTRLDQPLQGWVNRLIGESVRLSDLVQDLLDLALIDRESSQCLHLNRVNLPDLVQSAWLNLEPLSRKKQLQLRYLGPDFLPVQIDEARIYRVLMNLIDNSIKYSPPWEVIDIHISIGEAEGEGGTRGSNGVWLEVIDSGTGFAEQDLPHVFERFYRADPARSRLPTHHSGSGTWDSGTSGTTRPPDADRNHRASSGLGLSIVRQIVEAHQGIVLASNHPKTGGGWLRIWLPQEHLDLESLPANLNQANSGQANSGQANSGQANSEQANPEQANSEQANSEQANPGNLENPDRRVNAPENNGVIRGAIRG
ncbi:MAG: ATP-binding protein [Cyanobacteria bacterium J069]